MSYAHQSVAQGHRMPVSQTNVEARATFISKTYSHLLGGILVFALAVTALLQMGIGESLARTVMGSGFGWLVFMGGIGIAGWFASRMAITAESAGAQYGAFGIYIVLQAVLFAPLMWIAATFYPGVITDAGLATVVGFSALTGIAFVTRKDFSFLGGLLKWGFICALGLIVASLIFGFNMGLLFSVAMVALAGAAILYDTSNVLHHYPEDKHVAASLALFASVALMLWYMIQIFIATRD